MFRKTLAAAMASCMMLSVGTIGKAAEKAPRFGEAIGAMRALNIMIGDETGAFRPDDAIKRSEFAKVAIHALGIENIVPTFSTRSAFPDVSEKHWAVGYIGAAAAQGIVIGDTNGNFRPDDPISYEEAVTVFVRMAGYEPAAQSKGGYPSGYLTVAKTGGMLDKVPSTPREAVDRATVAQMTFGTLRMPMMEETGKGHAVTDNTLLETRLHAKEIRGILEATAHTSLSGEAAGEGRVRIDGKTYKTDICADALLGHSVRALVHTSETENPLFFLTSDSARTKTLTLSAEDVTSVSRDAVVYEGKNGSQTEMLSENPRLVFNGQPTDSIAVPEVGTVTLLANGNGKYSSVIVWGYETKQVESVYPASGKLMAKDGSTLTLDTSSKNLYFAIEDTDGNALALSNLQENDVLSIAKSNDGRMMKIRVCRETESGTVEEVSGKRITVNGKTKTLSPHFLDAISSGDRVKVYLDAFGMIAAAESVQEDGENYAYLVKTDTEQGIDGKVRIALLDKNGKMQTRILRDKIRLDDTAISAKEAAWGLGAYAGLVTFTEDSNGLVNALRRPQDETASFPQSHKGRFVYNIILNEAEYKAASMKLGTVSIDEDTVFFHIPDGETDSTKYTVSNYTALTDKTAYNALVYDMKEDMTASVILLTDASGRLSADEPLCLVSRVGTAQDKDGAQTDKLYGFADGKEISLLAAEGVTLSHLKEGDIVQYSKDAADRITEVRTLLTAENREEEGENELSDTVKTVYGKVIARFASSINVSGGEDGTENYKIKNANVYLYDSTRPTGKTRTASFADITAHAEDGSRVFLCVVQEEVREIIIVK